MTKTEILAIRVPKETKKKFKTVVDSHNIDRADLIAYAVTDDSLLKYFESKKQDIKNERVRKRDK